MTSAHTRSAPLLELEALSFAHPGAPRPVFHGVSAALPAGIGLVCGDEGSGKSTLLQLLAGRLRPGQGRLRLGGRELRPEQVAMFDAAEIAACEQQVVQQILAERVPRPPVGFDGFLQALGLAPHLAKPLYQLSAGSRRKVFLAATLVQERPLTLLDQPFMALDRPSVDALTVRFQTWAGHTDRLLLIADYQAPQGLALSSTLDLDRLR